MTALVKCMEQFAFAAKTRFPSILLSCYTFGSFRWNVGLMSTGYSSRSPYN